ncbi:hypothetical protein QTH90_30780 [Variovorax sp. J2P1-59]|uniref:hypothetical protein n=1 Tax=Variovorax flavidus TaxID=3053501 RepID=UPI002577DA91|nr:hypothetical protein [Variovorax sp. J2P1-59]MDM0078827.1 hypothetical protein [Variovorax sp. J2P1-59]
MEDVTGTPAVTDAAKIVTFHRAFTPTLPPMRGDKTGLGALPTAAFQYCEAMRSAASFGWYIFPPIDATLRWDGHEALYMDDSGRWHPLSSVYLGDEFADYWDEHAPEPMKGWRIPFMSSLFVPGIVQVWSGIFVSTAENWSVLARPLANVDPPSSYMVYEGLVETDQFKPCPLFVNIKLLATDHDIVLSRMKPLFQVQPIHRDCYSEATMASTEAEGLRPPSDGVAGMSMADWKGLERTTRSVQAIREADGFGGYGAAVRRRGKTGGSS